MCNNADPSKWSVREKARNWQGIGGAPPGWKKHFKTYAKTGYKKVPGELSACLLCDILLMIMIINIIYT
ncbi:hypothetical protein C173_07662 [Paenibacillus sp. FSL R7-277]|nr:hypothetical protein C173_07662 [Paenibacillus sp. FSL R7-277]